MRGICRSAYGQNNYEPISLGTAIHQSEMLPYSLCSSSIENGHVDSLLQFNERTDSNRFFYTEERIKHVKLIHPL